MSVFHNNALIGAGGGTAAAAAVEVATKSLRFNRDDDAMLTRTLSSGNRRKWTWAAWIKRVQLGSQSFLFQGEHTTGHGSIIEFNAADQLDVYDYVSSYNYRVTTTRNLRDPSAWYHIVVAFDSAQSTAADRVKIYINGGSAETDFANSSYPSQNSEHYMNSAVRHIVGRATFNNSFGSNATSNVYLADVYFIDGSALDPTSFGAYDDNGVWQASVYSGTYGTNGFHLAFGDSTSSAALGTDSSGNDNTFTVNNISGDAVGLSTANQGFDVLTYTGNGSTQSISGLSFGAAPDFVWIKQRDATKNHGFYDVVRGATKRLASNLTNSEATDSNLLTSFDSNGFSLGNDSEVNENNKTYVAWCWKAGGSASSNTDGTITSSVSANTTYGFSVVGYTGNNTAGATVGHGLSSIPKWIIVKSRDQTGQFWHVYHASLDADEYAYLNNSNAVTSGNDFMNGTRPTSSVFSLGNGNGCNKSGDNVIAYCWAEVSGFSKISSYNGSGGAATKVVTGFRPRYIIARPINDSNGNRWHIVDTERGVGGSAERLFAEDSATHTARQEVLIENDGFVVTNTTTDSGSLNRNTEYIYAAFASKPSGEEIDSLFDVPTNGAQSDTGAGGEVSGNYCCLNPLDNGGLTLSNGNLDFTNANTSWDICRSTYFVSSGKWYWEVTVATWDGTGAPFLFGIANSDQSVDAELGQTANSWAYLPTGQKRNGGSTTSYGSAMSTGAVVGVALDMDAGTLSFYLNGISQGQAFSSISGEVSPAVSVISTSQHSGNFSINFGQRAFEYGNAGTNRPAATFKALCTANLATPTIADGRDYFDAKLWTGNSTDQRAITGYQFSPDWVWIKRRNASYAHPVMDTVRGLNSGHAGVLYTSATNAEDTGATSSIRSFNSDGFNLGTDGGVNFSGSTYVGWAWDAGSSTVSNTDGSITSSVRASTASGFSIVSYTGNGSSGTVGHGLSSEPHAIIAKDRDASTNWFVYLKDLGSSALLLNKVDAVFSPSPAGINAASSSTFTLGGARGETNTSGNDYIAYCISPVAGFSAVGSYTGNGSSSDGVYVHLGFRPAFLMIKGNNNLDFGGSIVASYSWFMYDSARNTYNPTNSILAANKAFDEEDAAAVDFLSNGFKLRNNNAPNATVAQYYIAFAENPFQANGGLAR